MRKRQKRNRTALSLNYHGLGVEDCTGSTHPRTQHGPVRGRLMLRMVPGVFSSLRLCQTTDGKDAEHERDRKEFSECLVHARRHFQIGVWLITDMPTHPTDATTLAY